MEPTITAEMRWAEIQKNQPKYRTALEGALTEEGLRTTLEEIHTLVEIPPCDYDEGSHITSEIRNKIEDIFEYFDKLGFEQQEYEKIISMQRIIIEEAYEFMTLNTNRQRVPRETLLRFKHIMKKVKEIVRANKHDREHNED